jgi:hypothetical protein
MKFKFYYILARICIRLNLYVSIVAVRLDMWQKKFRLHAINASKLTPEQKLALMSSVVSR